MANTISTRAYAKGVDQTPRKVTEVAALVRGRTVADALVILEHTPRRAARPVAKVIASAKANALNNHGVAEKDMIISRLIVSAGPRLKRFRAGARGMAKPYQKKTSHILVEVSGQAKIKETKPAPKKAAAKKETK